ARLCRGTAALDRGARRAAAALARRMSSFSSDPSRRLAQRAARRAGAPEGPVRIFPQAALPPGGDRRARLRHRRMNESAPSEQRVIVYTDGGCAPTNPGPGGWAAILIKGKHQKELKGGEPLSTNNR